MHSNDMDTFQTLLNDDSTNGDGWTILHAAASLNLNVNRMEYVALLLQSSRVDVLAVTSSKSATALHIACDRNDAEFARAICCRYIIIDTENKSWRQCITHTPVPNWNHLRKIY